MRYDWHRGIMRQLSCRHGERAATSGQGNSPTSSHKIGHRRHNQGCSILANFPLIGAGRIRPFAGFDQNQSMTSLGAKLSREGSEGGNHAFEKCWVPHLSRQRVTLVIYYDPVYKINQGTFGLVGPTDELCALAEGSDASLINIGVHRFGFTKRNWSLLINN